MRRAQGPAFVVGAAPEGGEGVAAVQPLRSLLLWLSHWEALGDRLERWPPSKRLVSRFVAGRRHDEAVAAAQPLIARGFTVSFSLLGEGVTSEAEAAAAVGEYHALLEAVAQAGIAAETTIAVKPSLLGLAVGQEVAAGALQRVAEASAEIGTGLELDMERAASVDATLALYRRGRAHHPEMGVALQASLRRSEADLQGLIEEGVAHVRIVKGAYAESGAIAYSGAGAIASAFHRLVRMALAPEAMRGGAFLAVGTHDLRIIAGTRTRAFRKRTPAGRWEVQMLYGVRPRLQAQLLREGYPVRVYLPYGRRWYPYVMRRLAERPANLWFALQQLFRHE